MKRQLCSTRNVIRLLDDALLLPSRMHSIAFWNRLLAGASWMRTSGGVSRGCFRMGYSIRSSQSSFSSAPSCIVAASRDTGGLEERRPNKRVQPTASCRGCTRRTLASRFGNLDR